MEVTLPRRYMDPTERLNYIVKTNLSNITLDGFTDTALSSLYTNTNNTFKELSTHISNLQETNKNVLNKVKEDVKEIIDSAKYNDRKETNIQGKNGNGDTKVVNGVSVIKTVAQNLNKAAIEYYLPKDIIENNLNAIKDIITNTSLTNSNIETVGELVDFKVNYVKTVITMCSKLVPYYTLLVNKLKETLTKIDKYTDNELMVGIPDAKVMDTLEYFSTLDFISKDNIVTLTLAVDKINIREMLEDKQRLSILTEEMCNMYNNVSNTTLEKLKLHSIIKDEIKKKAIEDNNSLCTYPFIYKKELVEEADKFRTKVCSLVLVYNNYNFELKDVEYLI